MKIIMSQETYDQMSKEIETKNIFSLISYLKGLYNSATIVINNNLEDNNIVIMNEEDKEN